MAVRVIVAGVGPRGREWVRTLRSESGCELVACADSNEDVLRQSAAALGVPSAQCFRSLAETLETIDCDAVIVATAADCHAEACELALSHGRAVLVEKPFTTNLGEAVGLVRLAEQKGLPLVVAQNYRYMRSFRTVRRLVADGALGRVGIVICQYYRVPHTMVASLTRLPHSVLWGVGVHHLDALRYVLGQRVTGVAADSFTLPWGGLPPGASLRAMLSLADGARVFYSATYESSGHEFFERGQEFYLRLVGERATLHVFHRWLVLCERGRWPRLVRRGPRETSEECILLRQLERALTAGSTPDANGRDNLQTMAVVEACVRSAAEGRWVNPQELLDEAEKSRACARRRT
ncbi:MAG TPA: Gfo/Idh/MocA family oxidoreductase [Candidatus Binatia bacterium]|nr:Gfo/Idh/MocA family oxidoreductase [Candidatus Binatia bacterium]